MKRWPVLVLMLTMAPVAFGQPDDRYHLTVGNASGLSGTSASVSIDFESTTGTLGAPSDMLAWSYGVCHDPLLVDVTAVTNGTATAMINAGNPPASNLIEINPFGDGFYVGVIIDFLAIVTLPPGNHQLNVATYDLLGVDGTAVPLTVCETLAFCPTCPPITLAFEGTVGAFATPVLQDGTIFIGATPPGQFVRGDCNTDGAINIADPVFALSFLFPSGPPPILPCEDACDTNDDGALNIADAVALLSALFTGGIIPGPNSCGPDLNTTDSLDCVTYAPCP